MRRRRLAIPTHGRRNLQCVLDSFGKQLEYSTGAQKDGDLAHGLSSRLNEAYQTLLHPLARAEYILSQNGYSVSESDQVEDMEFMMEIMEARETIEEATPADIDKIEELLDRNKGECGVSICGFRG